MRENKENIMVGDYVEPTFDYNELHTSDYYNQEDLYGFVVEKSEDMITIEGISSKKMSTWKEILFRKAPLPNIFKTKNMIRTKK